MPRKFDRVPELSLKSYTDGSAAARAAFIDALREGFEHFGFIILKDHAASPALLQRAYRLAAEFFALPESEKRRYRGPDGQRGYTPFGAEHAKDSTIPDLKEFWHVGREFEAASPLARVYPPNIWPERPERFRDVFLTLYDALERAGMAMLEALAPSLGLSRDYFRDMAGDGNSILRLLHYPPVSPDAAAGALRAAPHEDINLITILVAANGAGLELLDRDGKWLPVDTEPDNLIVDAGDMLARATNDVIPATTHRVVNPPETANVSRYSMPFFMHPRPGAVLSCIESCRGAGAKYEAVTADAFLRQRLKEIGLAG
ncbi:MAG: isopenicillin N synthase family dioxygenase [Amphiplicatus sp.]